MSGYAFILGMMTLFVLILIWVPLYYLAIVPLADGMNSLVTDPDVIAKNNISVNIIYFTPFIIFLILFIAMLKSTLEDDSGDTYVVAQ
jgi:hypothetical protein